MSKQTAVDWLEEQIYSTRELDLKVFIQQAKEMEKQQIIDSYVKGANNQIYGVDLSGLEYYNETFNK
jgi:hypothetical protein